MALENLTPSNRMEAILDGQDIEPSNRKEYFMQKAVSAGGGSSLPSYSSADVGKVLTVGEPAQTVIVPEQSETLGQEQTGDIALSNVNYNALAEGLVYTAVVNGVEHTCELHAESDTEYIIAWDWESTRYFRFLLGEPKEAHYNCGIQDPGTTITVSLTASAPKGELKWEAGGILNLSSDKSTGALDKNYTEIKAAISAGILPVMFADDSVSIPIAAAIFENNAFNVYGISVRQGALSLIKWSAPFPNAPLTPVI